ncbi:MAG: hypothetical protein LBO66_07410 [Deltaproteobacteria bacterium]|nr:hypothetical protein [Deltaproteobacteria bacterium]
MTKQDSVPWRVFFSGKAEKQKERLPETIKPILNLLRRGLEEEGPERRDWPHYGPIKMKVQKPLAEVARRTTILYMVYLPN